MSLAITGKITNILDRVSGTSQAGKEWEKQTFVIDTEAKFNPLVAFGVFGAEKCDEIIKPLNVGDTVEVHFNLSSREFNDKYYTQADAWRVNNVSNEPQQGVSESQVKTAEHAEAADDLPF